MKIFAILVSVIGMLISGICSLGIVYSIYSGIEGAKNAGDASGIGMFAQKIANAQMFGFVNLFGLFILFIGVLLMTIALLKGDKQPTKI